MSNFSIGDCSPESLQFEIQQQYKQFWKYIMHRSYCVWTHRQQESAYESQQWWQ